MAEITFHANISQGVSSTPSDPTAIDHSAGSGLGLGSSQYQIYSY
jgi:hypothetical protein